MILSDPLVTMFGTHVRCPVDTTQLHDILSSPHGYCESHLLNKRCGEISCKRIHRSPTHIRYKLCPIPPLPTELIMMILDYVGESPQHLRLVSRRWCELVSGGIAERAHDRYSKAIYQLNLLHSNKLCMIRHMFGYGILEHTPYLNKVYSPSTKSVFTTTLTIGKFMSKEQVRQLQIDLSNELNDLHLIGMLNRV